MTNLTRSAHPFSRCLAAGLLAFFLAAAAALPALAHEMKHLLSRAEAVTVQFSHSGDSPPLFEPYEVFAPGSDTPFQAGRINTLGEVTFRPHQPGQWRIRMVTEDGHGATVQVDVDAAGEVHWQQGRVSSLVERILAALGYLLGFFGLLAIWRVRANRPRKR